MLTARKQPEVSVDVLCVWNFKLTYVAVKISNFNCNFKKMLFRFSKFKDVLLKSWWVDGDKTSFER